MLTYVTRPKEPVVKRLLFTPFALLFAALAALTVGNKPRRNAVPGDLKLAVLPITFPTKYVQNEDLKPSAFGFARVKYGWAVITGIGTGTVNVANVIYNYKTGKLILVDETPAQIAAEAEVKGVEVLVFAYGN